MYMCPCPSFSAYVKHNLPWQDGRIGQDQSRQNSHIWLGEILSCFPYDKWRFPGPCLLSTTVWWDRPLTCNANRYQYWKIIIRITFLENIKSPSCSLIGPWQWSKPDVSREDNLIIIINRDKNALCSNLVLWDKKRSHLDSGLLIIKCRARWTA